MLKRNVNPKRAAAPIQNQYFSWKTSRLFTTSSPNLVLPSVAYNIIDKKIIGNFPVNGLVHEYKPHVTFLFIVLFIFANFEQFVCLRYGSSTLGQTFR